MKQDRRHYSLLILMTLAFLIRGGALFVNLDSFNADPDQYKALARNLRTEGVYGSGTTPTAFRPPAYPAMLAAISFATKQDRPVITDADAPSGVRFSLKLSPNGGIAFLHWVLGLLTVFLVFQIGRQLLFSPRLSALAGFLVTIDPILLQQSRLAMTETAATFFAVLIISSFIRIRHMKPSNRQRLAFFAVGILTGTAILCRPAFLLFAILCFPILVIFEFQKKIAWVSPAIFLAGAAVVLLPWGVRNQRELGRFTVTTTHGGYTLLLANNDFLYDDQRQLAPLEGVWNPEKFHRFWNEKIQAALAEKGVEPGSVAAELLQDDLASDEALGVMRERKGDCAIATLWRIAHLWQPMPYQTDSAESQSTRYARTAVGVFYLAELLLAAAGLGVLLVLACLHKSPYLPVDRSDWILLVLLILSVQLPHLLYWTNMRMRAPVMPAVALLVILVLARIFIFRRFQKIVTPEKAALSGRF